MARVNASVYNMLRPIDMAGSFQKGLGVRDQIDQQARRQQEQAWQDETQKAYGLGIIQNPDGTTTFDQAKSMNALSSLQGNPLAMKAAQEMGLGMQQRAFEKEKYQNTLKQQEIENDLARQRLSSDAANRAESRAERRYLADLGRQEKMQALQTPYGLANTPDDAKQLKEGHEAKANFDSKIQEMIDLRNKYGTEYFNREAVARGKQLSKDLLLEYKNMAKLGVLSKSDEDIINAIIPEDPLGNDWAPGQDPILSNLQKFKADSDRDFKTRIQTRTRSGLRDELGRSPKDPTGKKPSWAL